MSKLGSWKTVFFLCAAWAVAAIGSPAQTFTTLANFDGTTGSVPYGSLVQGIDGNLYGTTTFGGAKQSGTVFRITPGGILTSLYSFCAQTGCADGASPAVGLVLATNGNFYGTTQYGGASCVRAIGGCGTVFEITPGGTFTTLYSFCTQAGCPDGAFPLAGLVQGADGNLYGSTPSYGANGSGGTLFKITPSGTLNTVYSFCSQTNCADGASPSGTLVQAGNGNFYGTTALGGAEGPNFGTVFEITSGGALTTLSSFCSQSGCTDGEHPDAGLVLATDGNFYGTTFDGGPTAGARSTKSLLEAP